MSGSILDRSIIELCISGSIVLTSFSTCLSSGVRIPSTETMTQMSMNCTKNNDATHPVMRCCLCGTCRSGSMFLECIAVI